MRYVRYFDVKQTYSVAREIKLSEFTNMVSDYIAEAKEMMFGIISLNPDAIYEFGLLEKVVMDESALTFQFRHVQTGEIQTLRFANDRITETYDVQFAIDDEVKGNVSYPVYYVSVADNDVADDDKEVTYYIASKQKVTRPLDCVAEFFIRANSFKQDITKQNDASFCRIDHSNRNEKP